MYALEKDQRRPKKSFNIGLVIKKQIPPKNAQLSEKNTERKTYGRVGVQEDWS